MHHVARTVVGLTVPAVLTLLFLPAAWGCPFCTGPSQTLSEQIAQADVLLLAQWVAGTRPDDEQPGDCTFEIVQVGKAPAVRRGAKKERSVTAGEAAFLPSVYATGPMPNAIQHGTRVELSKYRPGKKGDLFLLIGTAADTVLAWNAPLETTEAGFNYVAQAPALEQRTTERLKYFLRFLEFPDRMVADDAFAEFANAPYKDITPLAGILPREKVRAWALSAETQPNRLGLYGLFLGLCGNEDDVKVMAEKIGQQTDEFRLGMDGLMSGYLLLTGRDGLPLLEETKLKNAASSFSETYSAMQAIRFMWTYAPGRIEQERLCAAMRHVLDRPELADQVIPDLARWQDWSVQDRLMSLYGAEGYDFAPVKNAVIRYMLASTRERKPAAGPSDAAASEAKSAEPAASGPPEAVRKKGQEYLKRLRERDPKTVADVERLFSFN